MGDTTLKQALEEYEKIYMASRNFAQRTRIEYLNDLEDMIRFLEQLGIKEVKAIGLAQLERYLADLDNRGIAGSTRKRKVVAIRSFLGYLYQDSYISTNLAQRLIPPFAEPKSPRYLTKTEYECLLAVCAHNPRDFALIQLLLQTGMKLSELIRLTINDVELPPVSRSEENDLGYLHLTGGERQKARILPLNYKACLALSSYFKIRPSTTSPILFINRFGRPLSPRGVEKIVRKYLRAVGILKANVQSLRHTFGIHRVISGSDLRTIQELMGHKDSRTTSLYFILANSAVSKEVEKHSL